jgi:hypothetical protein
MALATQAHRNASKVTSGEKPWERNEDIRGKD